MEKVLMDQYSKGQIKSHCASEDESHDGFMAFQVYPDRTRLVPVRGVSLS